MNTDVFRKTTLLGIIIILSAWLTYEGLSTLASVRENHPPIEILSIADFK